MDILITFAIGAVVIAVLMHLHFKRAPDVRTALVSPPVFALIGALIGISLRMIWASKEHAITPWSGQIHLGESIPSAFMGTMVGGLLGIGVQNKFARLGRGKIGAVVLTLMLLAVSIGIPLGWTLCGAFQDRAVEGADGTWQVARTGMIWGGAIGCFVGLAVGLLDACFGGRRPKHDVTTPSVENAAP